LILLTEKWEGKLQTYHIRSPLENVLVDDHLHMPSGLPHIKALMRLMGLSDDLDNLALDGVGDSVGGCVGYDRIYQGNSCHYQNKDVPASRQRNLGPPILPRSSHLLKTILSSDHD
jgi:hypothetical protein